MSIIDQIDLSLEKASSLQQKRFEAEESKQKSLNYDLNQLRSQFNESLDEEMTPEKSYSQNYSQSQYSPLRNDIKQLELQKQLLQSSERKLQQEIDDSENDDNQQQIYPKYENNLNKQRQQQQHHQQKPLQDQFKQHNKQQKQNITKLKSQKYQPEKTQIKKELQQKTQKSIPKSTQIITRTTTTRNEKENDFIIQEQKPEYQKLKQQIKSVKEQVSNQLIKNDKIKQDIQQDESKNQYKIRGYRDQAEIKYFGRPLPCNECVFLLNKGMSSDYCSQHGKMNKERPPNKTLPKRLAKYF